MEISRGHIRCRKEDAWNVTVEEYRGDLRTFTCDLKGVTEPVRRCTEEVVREQEDPGLAYQRTDRGRCGWVSTESSARIRP